MVKHVEGYGGPQLSRQNQKSRGKNKIPHGKTINLTAKTKYLTTKPKTSRQNQILHSKNKIPHGKTENLTAKTKTARQNQKPHGKNKRPHANPNTSQQKPNTTRQKQIPTAKPKLFCVCREVFGFAVTFVGHRRGEYEQGKYILNSFVTVIS